jgi:hypothetical protein
MKYLNIIVISVVLTGCFGKKPQKTGMEGETLPSFKLLLEDSTTYFDMKNIPKGKPFVLLYFGPYCPYSRAQVEDIVTHSTALKETKFYFFTSWPIKDLKIFSANYKLKKYPNIITGVDYENFFPNYMSATAVPFMAFYDKEKKLNKAYVGKINIEDIQSGLSD